MTAQTLIQALGLPQEAIVSRRVPKKLLSDEGAINATDKRSIQEDIEELMWTAILKPTNMGVPIYRDAIREYLEIAVLHLTLRAEGRSQRLTELIHRAVPYPVVLITTQSQKLSLSLAQKRFAQNESGKTVLDGNIVGAELAADHEIDQHFLNNMALKNQPTQNLLSLYTGWIQCVEALLASRITGHFSNEIKPESADARREALNDRAMLEQEITMLRAQAAKEKQMNRRVELNLAIQKLEKRIKEQLSKL